MKTPQWWQDAVAYQIYPRSFADSNGDGIGDLQGIIEKLDYLSWLGINALWICPFFPSPLLDVGYDVSDYKNIAPEYGTLADFDRLIQEAHKRGMRVILDLVLNHTSDQHDWFQRSKSSKENRYRDWYVWRDGVDGGPPNDWEATFGGSAWEYDETTGQYYYHFFFKEQPDLNWRNPEVVNAIFDTARFWMERGADGFRLDAIGAMFEDEALTPANTKITVLELWQGMLEAGGDWAPEFELKMRYQHELPETFDALRGLRRVVDEYPGCLLLGESDDVTYYGTPQNPIMHSVFNFKWTNLASPDAPAIRELFVNRLPTVPSHGWECNTLGNHDRHRIPKSFADGLHDRERYHTGLALTLLMHGTPMIYYGEEIGMTDYYMPNIENFRDNLGVWAYEKMIERGTPPADALMMSQTLVGRDKCRTPMQWANATNGGFSPDAITPWLPVNPNYAEGINVAEQRSDPASTINFVRQLAGLRSEYVALRRGDFRVVENLGDVLAFWRRTAQESCIVIINMSAEPQSAAVGMSKVRRIYSNLHNEWVLARDASRLNPQFDLAYLPLGPYEVFVGLVQ
jgi:alpha-glucosidase